MTDEIEYNPFFKALQVSIQVLSLGIRVFVNFVVICRKTFLLFTRKLNQNVVLYVFHKPHLFPSRKCRWISSVSQSRNVVCCMYVYVFVHIEMHILSPSPYFRGSVGAHAIVV